VLATKDCGVVGYKSRRDGACQFSNRQLDAKNFNFALKLRPKNEGFSASN